MVSIVIPVYNVAKYLPQCLNSLSKQDYVGEKEIILVDDGSTDSSPSICEEFCNTHPWARLIRQDNKGLSEARNTGVMAASGNWLFFLDSDDWLTPNALSTLLTFGETHSSDIVVGSFYYAHEDYLLFDNRWFNGKDPFVLDREDAMKELILQHCFKNFAWGKLYRTESAKKHPFHPGVYYEDAFWQHLMIDEAQRVGVIPEPLYYYRQRNDSISGVFSARNLDLLKGNEERFLFIMDRYPALTKLAARGFWSLCFQQKEFADGKFPEIKAFYNRIEQEYGPLFSSALRMHPFYFASHHCPAIVKVLQLSRRVFTHYFAKRPKRIPFKAQW